MSHDDRDPLDAYLADVPLNLPPIAPDGGFVPGPGFEPEPIPAATPETMICLRDCRHYLELHSRFGHGNARGTLAREPVRIDRYCRAITGTEIDLTDELVRECSEWDPMDPSLKENREFRRREWFKKNPLVQITAKPEAVAPTDRPFERS